MLFNVIQLDGTIWLIFSLTVYREQPNTKEVTIFFHILF